MTLIRWGMRGPGNRLRGRGAGDGRHGCGASATLFETVVHAHEFDQRLVASVAQATGCDSHDPRIPAVAAFKA